MTNPSADPVVSEAMLRPDCYPHPAPEIERLETHISWVFLAGPYAYKVKKPVRLDFVDFASLESRRHCCLEEVRLNRRLAPDVYLDVVDICATDGGLRIGGDGPAVEVAVRMRRFPQDDLASRMLDRGALAAPLVDALALRIADFHSGLPPAEPSAPYGSSESVRRNALQNFEQIDAMLDLDSEDQASAQSLRQWTERELDERDSEFESRRASGMVRECHGDLHLGNIALIGGELVPFDCIEFNAGLRWNDVMSEVAFLVMDLFDRGAPTLAWQFLNGWLEASGDYAGLPMLRFYLAYRAVVRAKIHLIRATQSASDPSEAARLVLAYREYIALADRCTRIGRPAIVLMHGLSGCGKSTVAQDVAQSLGAVRLRSDVERKRLQGLKPQQRSGSAIGSGLYEQDFTRAAYARLAQLARLVVEAGYTAVVDATFLQRWQRAQLVDVATATRVPIVTLSVQAPENVLRQRIEARAAQAVDPSEATVAVLAQQIATAEPVRADERLPVIDVDGRDGFVQAVALQLEGVLASPTR